MNKFNTKRVSAVGFVAFAEGLNVFRLSTTAAGYRLIISLLGDKLLLVGGVEEEPRESLLFV